MIIYAIPSLVAAVTVLLLIVYTYSYKKRSKINQILYQYLFILFVVSLCDLFIRIAETNLVIAVSVYLVQFASSVVVIWFLLYFALMFPSKSGFLKNRTGQGILFVLFVVGLFYIAHEFGMIRSGAVSANSISPNQWGYYTPLEINKLVAGPLYLLEWIHFFIMLMASIFVFIWRYFEKNIPNKKSILYVLHGIMIMYGFGYTTDFLLPLLGISVMGLSSIGIVLLCIILTYAIIVRGIIPGVPAIEPKTMNLEHPYESGHYYLVVEDINYPEKSYEIFCRHVKSGIQGLVITSKEPVMIREKYGLQKTPIICISNQKETNMGETPQYENVVYIAPTSISKLLEPVLEFLKANKGAIIIIDCLEYIVVENSGTLHFRAILLETVRNFISFIIGNSDAILVIPESKSWLSSVPDSDVIKTKNLLKNSNFPPILLLERLINVSTPNLKKEQKDEILKILAKLVRTDKFFTNVKLREDGLIVDFSYDNRFTYQDMLHYIKLFIKEMKAITDINEKAVIQEIDKFALSKHEYDFETGHGYIVYNLSSKKILEIIIDLIERGHAGIYISRNHPKQYWSYSNEIKDRASFLWMTDIGRGENVVLPRLEHILKEVEDFIAIHSDRSVIVVLDNISFLVKYTGSFDEVHLFIANLRDIISQKNGVLIVPVDKAVFESNETALLTQELIELDYTENEIT